MNTISLSEQELLTEIHDEKLKVSIELIRQAMKNIWSSEVRVIRGYTDHGENHCARLAENTTKLLKANNGRPFSETEIYLLLSSIYLHDIGMQCDVMRLNGVKELAEKEGASFDGIAFDAESASSYSYDEQKAIRSNHNYLSAGWIKYAFQTGETALGNAAKTIPSHLIRDIMDICLHHTKLPIGDCSPTLALGGEERKQLVAAVLRFADELDVASNRVTIDTVKNFKLEPENSVYWWLHHATTVIINPANVVKLTVSLSPKDYLSLGELVRTIFIVAFQNKNRPVLEVLKHFGLPIVIDADSDVKSYEFTESLPCEIVNALQNMAKLKEPAMDLANEVKTWLQAIRYEVSPVRRRDDRSVDMEATLELGTVKQRILIRCISDEIMPHDVVGLRDALTLRLPEGWLVSQTRVSPSAHDKAAEDNMREYIKVFALKDFLKREVWSPYIEALTALVEKEQLPNGGDLYVDLGCYKAQIDEETIIEAKDNHISLDAYIDDWLNERGKKHISLLGEFGTGKTWFCRHYAYRQLQRYWQNPMSERFPLLITLRTFAKAMTAQQLINDALLVQYQLPFIGNPYEIFQQMNRNGKLLLILDGFDEMARQVDKQTVVDNFWELASLVDEDSKVVLTSRTEYFRQGKESENILAGLEFGRKTLELSPPKFEVIHLEQLTDEQIRRIIIGRLSPEKGLEVGIATADKILTTRNLAEMARKPLLVELLLASLDEVSPDVLQKPAQVYLYATNKLLLRNIKTKRTFTTTADKLYFLCELAWEMIDANELRIHYKDIPRRIKLHFGDRIKDQHELDHWDFDLRNQTLLHRDAAGYYEFAHKSLAEFFVALKFAAEIGCLAPVFTKTYVEEEGKEFQFPIKENIEWDKLAMTFGRMPLAYSRLFAVRQLLEEIISLYPYSEKKLWKLVYGTRSRSTVKAYIIGGNAFNLLRRNSNSFESIDFSRIRLLGADFSGANLSGANFSEAELNDCFFRNADISHANFDNARVKIIDIGVLRLNCQGARIDRASLGIPELLAFKKGGAILSAVQEKEIVQHEKRYKTTR